MTTLTSHSPTVDITDLPPENRECLQRIAAMRGLSVAATIAALVREDTDRVLAAVSAHHAPPADPEGRAARACGHHGPKLESPKPEGLN